MYSRSAKGGEKGDPNRNPWLAKMSTRKINKNEEIPYMYAVNSTLTFVHFPCWSFFALSDFLFFISEP